MRKYVIFWILLFAGMVNCPAKNTEFATAWFKLALDDSGKIQLFDKDRNLIRTVDFTGKIPFLSHGKNTVVFDAEFSEGGNSVFKIEMKTTDQPESVKSEN
ncbi:MAG: hypothetical protein ABFD10_05965 [Prolixibacteraceae bacterium]